MLTVDCDGGAFLVFDSFGEIEVGPSGIVAARALELGGARPIFHARVDGVGLLRQRETGGAADRASFACEAFESVVHDDGLCTFRAARDQTWEIDIDFAPSYVGRGRGEVYVADDEGGFVLLAPPRGLRVSSGRLRVVLRAQDTMMIGVFPFRAPRVEHATWGVAHEGRAGDPFGLPSLDAVRAAAPHARLLALHAWFWREETPRNRPRFGRDRLRPNPWRNAVNEPRDEERFLDVVRSARAAGLAVVVYFSPFYSRAPEPLSEMTRLMRRFPIDGFYLDGLAADPTTARRLLRAARGVVGADGLLYLNASDHPRSSPRVPLPFIDGHADFVLRGGRGRAGLPLDTFLRRCISGRGSSNAQGVWCHYGSSGLVLPFDLRPPARHVQAARRAGVRIWRRSHWRGIERFDDA